MNTDPNIPTANSQTVIEAVFIYITVTLMSLDLFSLEIINPLFQFHVR